MQQSLAQVCAQYTLVQGHVGLWAAGDPISNRPPRAGQGWVTKVLSYKHKSQTWGPSIRGKSDCGAWRTGSAGKSAGHSGYSAKGPGFNAQNPPGIDNFL